jgi:hypothetical protein
MKRTARWVVVLAMAAAVVAPGAVPCSRASTVMVIEDFAPMRMIPSANAPRKAYAPLGLLLRTRRVGANGEFIEGTNAEERAFEDPAWLHYWFRPSSVLEEPGATKISLDLVVHQHSGSPVDSAHADFPGRRYSVAQFLADSTALPGSYYVTANDESNPGPWGGGARLLPAKPEPYDPPGLADRKKTLRAEEKYHLYLSLAGPRPIRSVRERVSVARVLAKDVACADFKYVQTEVMSLVERTRKVGGPGDTVVVPVPVIELTTTESAAEVLWSRIVYVADVSFEDGTAETIARRLFVTWPRCP